MDIQQQNQGTRFNMVYLLGKNVLLNPPRWIMLQWSQEVHLPLSSAFIFLHGNYQW